MQGSDGSQASPLAVWLSTVWLARWQTVPPAPAVEPPPHSEGKATSILHQRFRRPDDLALTTWQTEMRDA